MRVNDLVKPLNDPIDGTPKIPEGMYGVVKEIAGVFVKVQFGRDEKQYVYRKHDLTSIG